MVPNNKDLDYMHGRPAPVRPLVVNCLRRRLGPELWRGIVLAVSFILVLSNFIIHERSLAAAAQTITLTATPLSATKIQLTWRIDSPNSISSIRLYRAPGSAPQGFINIGSTFAGATSFTD